MTNRTNLALLVAIIGAFLLGVGSQVYATVGNLAVVLLALLMLLVQGLATPPKRREPKPPADPDESWRRAVDEP